MKMHVLVLHCGLNTYISVPHVKEMRDKSVKHKQALQLVNKLCAEMVHLPEKRATPMLLDSILRAAENGINEIVEVIMEMYPLVTFVSEEETGNDVFLWAATNRHENVFSIFYSLSDHLRQAYENRDLWGNNLMHICGKLAPPHRLNLVPGAALQMQRELQWFKVRNSFSCRTAFLVHSFSYMYLSLLYYSAGGGEICPSFSQNRGK